MSNPYEDRARLFKAERLANVIAPEWPRMAKEGYVFEDLLRPKALPARQLAAREAGVNEGSIETWQLVVKLLKDRAVAEAFQKAKEVKTCPQS